MTYSTLRFLAGLVQWPKPGKVGSYITLGLALARFVPMSWTPFCNIGSITIHLKLQVRVHPTFPHLQRSSQWPRFDRRVPGLRRCLHHRHGNLQVSIKLSWISEVSSLVFPMYLMYILCPTSNLQCPGFSITNGYVGSICMMSAPQVKFTVQWGVSSNMESFLIIVNP